MTRGNVGKDSNVNAVGDSSDKGNVGKVSNVGAVLTCHCCHLLVLYHNIINCTAIQ